MLLEQIQSDLKEALLKKEADLVSTLRFLLSALQNKQIAKRQGDDGELTDEEVIDVIRKQAKERKESIEAFKKGSRSDLVRKEERELQFLSKYLPQEATPEELAKIVDLVIGEIGASRKEDFGRVMKAVMEKVRGQAPGEVMAEVVRKKLA